VSKNDDCHYAGTTKVAVKVMGRNLWRGKPWGDLKQSVYLRFLPRDSSAERGYEIACRLSVCPSVCPWRSGTV